MDGTELRITIMNQLEREELVTRLEALNQAVIKWSAIYHGVGVDKGRSDCALCQKYLNNRRVCADCPVRKKTGLPACDDTPYQEWAIHFILDHWRGDGPYEVSCPECRRLAYKVLKFMYQLYLEEKYGEKKRILAN